MIKKWCIQNKYSIFIILLLIGFCGYFVSQSYGFLLYPDEFGYWTYAAMLAGYDWSDVVSLGSYYSYGYSLILFPIFILCKNAVIAYRVAIAVNFFLLVMCFLMWKKLVVLMLDYEQYEQKMRLEQKGMPQGISRKQKEEYEKDLQLFHDYVVLLTEYNGRKR